jgi:hypothetical protein
MIEKIKYEIETAFGPFHFETQLWAEQQPVAIGDGARIFGMLLLPCTHEGKLAEGLRFGNRLELCGEILLPCWGELSTDERRRRNFLQIKDPKRGGLCLLPFFDSDTLFEGFNHVRPLLCAETFKLTTALEARKMAWSKALFTREPHAV